MGTFDFVNQCPSLRTKSTEKFIFFADLHEFIRFKVDGRGGFVQDQNA